MFIKLVVTKDTPLQCCKIAFRKGFVFLQIILPIFLKHLGVCIAQNGPGITNFVTGVAAAYWAHSPVVVMTPETGSLTNGLGGFQETNQVII